jgi:hypothetical protein
MLAKRNRPMATTTFSREMLVKLLETLDGELVPTKRLH